MRQKWNMYVSFGIHQFICPQHDYVMHRAQETVVERHLRFARYYRYHLENLTHVDSYLIRTMGAVETALAISHPGFFDMSTNDMDKYMASSPEIDSEMHPSILQQLRLWLRQKATQTLWTAPRLNPWRPLWLWSEQKALAKTTPRRVFKCDLNLISSVSTTECETNMHQVGKSRC